MTWHARVGGSWQTITAPEVKVSGSWRAITNAYVRVSGVWQEFFTSTDVTPDAVNWPNVTMGVSTGDQTFTGINTTIQVSAVKTIVGGLGDATLSYSKNGAAFAIYTSTISIVSGDTLAWRVDFVFDETAGQYTIYNDTDGGAALDSFNYTL